MDLLTVSLRVWAMSAILVHRPTPGELLELRPKGCDARHLVEVLNDMFLDGELGLDDNYKIILK
jgi:hypothetical protein